MDVEKYALDADSNAVAQSPTETADDDMSVGTIIDIAAERSYVRKLDTWLLPFMSVMYFFNSVDRSNLGNAETDGMTKDLGFVGEQYSLLILLFYIPNGLCDLPLNILTKRYSGKVMLPTLMVGWGSCALLQCVTHDFAGMLVIRLLLGAFEAGFFAGAIFYLTLFYNRGELAFRIALFFGSALLAAAFSGLISFGVFQIDSAIPGWKWLFIIEGGLTVIFGTVSYWWLPAGPQTAWFLTEAEKTAATARALRDGSRKVGEAFSWRACFEHWKTWKMLPWCIISLTYTVAFSTTANFLPQIVARLGFSVIKTNLWTVAPNATGFVVLLCVCKSSDHFRERSFHIVFALTVSLTGMIILAAIDAVAHTGVAYFACFLMAAGAYIPSCLVHSWHNNNNLSENARAVTTGLMVGLGNLGGVISGATFRTAYAPRYLPNLAATAACNVICIAFTLGLGGWMKRENRRRDRAQGRRLRAEDVDTDTIGPEGEKAANWRYFT